WSEVLTSQTSVSRKKLSRQTITNHPKNTHRGVYLYPEHSYGNRGHSYFRRAGKHVSGGYAYLPGIGKHVVEVLEHRKLTKEPFAFHAGMTTLFVLPFAASTAFRIRSISLPEKSLGLGIPVAKTEIPHKNTHIIKLLLRIFFIRKQFVL